MYIIVCNYIRIKLICRNDVQIRAGWVWMKRTIQTVDQRKNTNVVSVTDYNYVKAATSYNTRQAYRKDILHFISWGGVLPTTPDVIVEYLKTYANQLNPRTLQRRVTALKNWHLYQGFVDPTGYVLVRKTLTGIQNIHGKPKHKAPALQIEDLIKMASFLKCRGRIIDIRNNALLQIGFFGAFRRSEITAIKYEDIVFLPQGIEIIIPRSKTDQSGDGQKCAIPYGDKNLCPVTTLKEWCEQANIKSGYIFRSVSKSGTISQESIKASHLNIIIKNIAKICNLKNAEKYSSHSLRRGFATVASQQGASLGAIMRQGRWQNSNTALSYIDEGKIFDDNAANFILKMRK